MNPQEKTNILGVGISTLRKTDIVRKITDTLKHKKSLFVSTPNPEIVLNAQKDEELHYILNQCDLSVPDGIGLKFASWLMGKNINRWPGSEITTWLLSYAEEKNIKVSILNTKGGLSSNNLIETSLKHKYPKLDFIILAIDKEWSLPFYQELNIFKPQIVFVTLGSPYQEKFIYHNRSKLYYANILIGVGGSFDYITGKVRNAPILFARLGLEWFWRLLNIASFSYPLKRLKRISRAVFLFPILFLKWRFINPLIFRKNVACLLYKKIEQEIFILLLKRSDNSGHWQLPQGGTDNKSLMEAGIKELQEELGTFKITPKKSYSNIHKYKFLKVDKNTIQFKMRNYKGQKQGLMIAEFYGHDKDIKLNFWEYEAWEWVKLDKVSEKVQDVRQESTKKFITLFKKYYNDYS